MRSLSHLFENNRVWSERIRRIEPDFFDRLSRQQRPKYLWIGCADSRVPANEIVGLLPGELFVHRNIANVIVHSDLNCLSVMQFAVDVLQIEHIIVCGHYGCSGVSAALQDQRVGLADNWLNHLHDVHSKHDARIAMIPDMPQRIDRLCDLPNDYLGGRRLLAPAAGERPQRSTRIGDDERGQIPAGRYVRRQHRAHATLGDVGEEVVSVEALAL